MHDSNKQTLQAHPEAAISRVSAAQQAGQRVAAWLQRNRKFALLLFLFIYLLTGLYYVPADQQAIRVRFGKLLSGRIQPGLRYSLPYPVDQIIRLKVKEAQRLSIGGDDLSRALGVTDRKFAEEYLLSGDQNLVRIQAWIQYHIQDPGRYLFQTENLPPVLESAFLRCMTRAVSKTNVDEILTTGRIALQNEVQRALQAESDSLQLGVTITTVALEEVRPPEEVRDAFLDVANAREDRNRIAQEAIGYANQLLPRVRGSAQEMLQKAEIYRTELVNRATGKAERFTQVWSEYRKHRQVTMTRLFLETIDEVLPRMRKVILDDNGSKQGLDLDIFEVQP